MAESISEDYDGHSLELFKSLQGSLDEELENVLVDWIPQNPESCRVKYDFGYPLGKVLPLARICQLQPSARLVEVVLEAFPEAVATPNREHGRIPDQEKVLPATKGWMSKSCRVLVEFDESNLSNHREEPQHPNEFQLTGRLDQLDHQGIRKMNRSLPVSHQKSSHRGWLPLHYACKHGASLKVVQFLMDKYPAAVMTKNQDGWLPIHYACSAHAPLDVIQCLVVPYPETLQAITKNQGEIPLHCACRAAANARDSHKDDNDSTSSSSSLLDVVQFLTSRAPPPTASSWTSSTTASSNSSISSFSSLASTMTSSVSSSSMRSGVRIKTKSGFLPLHYACRCRAPFSVVKYMVEMYPDSVMAKTREGTLPLHEACRFQPAALQLIRFLGTKFPQAARIYSKTKRGPGMLPLHYACRFHAPVEVIRFLVEMYPAGVGKLMPTTGESPLHVACRYGAPVEVVQYLLAVEEDRQQNKLQGESSSAVCTATIHGDLPLHYACYAYTSKSAAEQKKDGGRDKDASGNDAPMTTAESTALTVVRELLRRYPKAAQIRGSRGVRPRHLIQHPSLYPHVSSFLRNKPMGCPAGIVCQ